MDELRLPTHELPSGEKSGWGGIVAIVIVVALLIIGGIYFFMNEYSTSQQTPAVGAATT